MHWKCGFIEKMPCKNVVSLTEMIGGCVQCNRFRVVFNTLVILSAVLSSENKNANPSLTNVS